jgi:hypothetical protein
VTDAIVLIIEDKKQKSEDAIPQLIANRVALIMDKRLYHKDVYLLLVSEFRLKFLKMKLNENAIKAFQLGVNTGGINIDIYPPKGWLTLRAEKDRMEILTIISYIVSINL